MGNTVEQKTNHAWLPSSFLDEFILMTATVINCGFTHSRAASALLLASPPHPSASGALPQLHTRFIWTSVKKQ